MSRKIFSGTFSALVTPFSGDGSEIDFGSFERLIDYQIKAGVQGFVFCGSTGEAATLSEAEFQRVLEFGKKTVSGRVKCIAGVGSSSTAKACELAAFVDKLELDGLLLLAPPYNKPPQAGLVAHFREVKKRTKLPIIAYNIPGRSAVNILPQTLSDLERQGVIVGVKEASGSLDQFIDLAALVSKDFALLAGDDSLVQAMMACAGCGVISAAANIAPELFVQLTSSALAGDFATSLQAQLKLLPIIRAMFIETNPIPIKSALALKGIIDSPAVRLPLVPASPATIEKIKQVLAL